MASSRVALAQPNTALLAPMPRVSVRTAMAAAAGFFRSVPRPHRRSCQMVGIRALAINRHGEEVLCPLIGKQRQSSSADDTPAEPRSLEVGFPSHDK